MPSLSTKPIGELLPPTKAMMSQVHEWLRSNQSAILADVQSLVEIETPSTEKALLDRGLSWLEHRAREMLGGCSVDRVDGGTFGDISVITVPSPSDQTVTVLCHYDTVWEAGTLDSWPFSITGDHAFGPGIYDMKAGIIQCFWAISSLQEHNLPIPNIRILLTGDEEIGSPSSRPIIEDMARDAAAVIVFEPSENGGIKTSRKGSGQFTLDVMGVAAHAGADYTSGTSAVDELARAILDLHALTDLDSGTTVNVGVIAGGTRSNVVAESAHAEIDVRVMCESEVSRIDEALLALKPASEAAEFTLHGSWNRPPMQRSDLTVEPYKLAQHVAQILGLPISEVAVGGFSDGNLVAALGVPVLDGMGAIGAHPHARNEYITVSGLADRSAIAAGVISALAGNS